MGGNLGGGTAQGIGFTHSYGGYEFVTGLS